jgi:hypothetical protein
VRHPGGKRVFFALAHLEDFSAAAILRIGSETTQTGVDATTAVAAQRLGPVRAAQPPPREPSHFIEVVPTIRRSGWSASADAELDAALRRHAGVALDHAILNFDGAA